MNVPNRRGLRMLGLVAIGVAGLISVSATPLAALAAQENPDGSQAVTVGMLSEGDARKFEPAELTIATGTTVTWQHISGSTHTATADPSKVKDPANVALPEGVEPWDSGDLTGGQSWSRTLDVPGTYRYFCIPHEGRGMVGTVIVTD